MTETDIRLRAATYDGNGRATMHIWWKKYRMKATYSGGEYVEVEVGAHKEVIHNDEDDKLRRLWNREDTDTKYGLLFTALEDWCRTNEHEDSEWVDRMLEFGKWS